MNRSGGFFFSGTKIAYVKIFHDIILVPLGLLKDI